MAAAEDLTDERYFFKAVSSGDEEVFFLGAAVEDDDCPEMERFFLAAEVLVRLNVPAAERNRDTRFWAIDELR